LLPSITLIFIIGNIIASNPFVRVFDVSLVIRFSHNYPLPFLGPLFLPPPDGLPVVLGQPAGFGPLFGGMGAGLPFGPLPELPFSAIIIINSFNMEFVLSYDRTLSLFKDTAGWKWWL